MTAPYLSSPLQQTAMTPAILEDISARLKQLIESTPATELDKNVRAFVTGAFARMDLVTREEFDIQKAVLERTRAKLKDLEQQVAKLEENAARHK
jgi:ubiquinone biosynthesis accessory factor UbiK